MITANCRDRFTAEDFQFVAKTLSRTSAESFSLAELLTDAETRDEVLDHPQLCAAILEDGATLRISPQLYFYVLVRRVMKETGLNHRRLCDYVAALLAEFSATARLRSPTGAEGPIQYLGDMLVALRNATASQQFLIRAHVGNYALFISGIFRETVERRAARGGPGVSFYEDVGAGSFHCAASHQVARDCELGEIFEQLSDGFHDVRRALNHLSDSLLHLDEPAPTQLLQP